MCIKFDKTETIETVEMANTPKTRLCSRSTYYVILILVLIMTFYPSRFMEWNDVAADQVRFFEYTMIAILIPFIAVLYGTSRIQDRELARLKSQSIDEGVKP